MKKGLDLRDWVLAAVPILEDMEERTAIIEYEGGLSRKEAERSAFNLINHG